MRRTLWLILGFALILACLCLPAAAASWLWGGPGWRGARATATLAPTPTVTAAPETAGALAAAVVPPRDSRALVARLKPRVGAVPPVVNADPPQHAVGDQARFWVANSDTLEVFQVTATLRVLSTHTEMWVQSEIPAEQEDLERAATTFDEQIYPAVHRYFGSEWTPGVDNNPRVVVLNARFSGAAGYYSSHDEFSHLANPYSNEREIFYMSASSATPGTDTYASILAHEFQHMVHWYLDSNEDSWVNEGASELSARLAGFGVTPALYAFARQPDTQLNAWSLRPDEETLPHYGASYLWMEYFLQRLGADALKAVIAEPANGIDGFEKVLGTIPGAPRFDDLYADWVLANLLDEAPSADARYRHQVADPRVRIETTHRRLPAQGEATVSQYGTDYIAVDSHGSPVRIDFSGNPTVAIVPNAPYQGKYQWWSNRSDVSDTTLTRALDLTGLGKATLRYALWYALEDGWDYGYVEVSTDDGATWKLLRTPHTTDYDPNGNAFGPGYTGYSGHPAGSKTQLASTWIREEVDLTPFAGRRILIRFEMVTDDAVNLPGLCIDDIAVPELGLADDAESEAAGWQAEGFVRMDNQLPQQYLVQVIEEGRGIRVHRLQLDARRQGTLALPGSNVDVGRIVLAVSGLTRYTTEPAGYRYSITALER